MDVPRLLFSAIAMVLGCCAQISADDDQSLAITSVHYEARDWPTEGRCRPGLVCTELARCRLVYHLVQRSCLDSDRLQSLRCGFSGSDPLVCCPPGAFNSPFEDQQVHYPPGVVVGSDPLPATTRPPQQVPGKRASCGRPAVKSKTRGLGSHPWVARIGFIRRRSSGSRPGEMEYPCCGSIISRTTILTAAHCALANSSSFKLHSVRVGEYDGSADLDCTVEFCGPPVQDVRIKQVVVHPSFAAKTFSNDVALLILRSPLNYTVTVQPICLLQNPKLPIVGRRATLVGWGKTPGQKVTPERQQLQELPIVATDSCKKLYNTAVPVSNKQLCVGGEEGKDACSGFGGSPLILLDHIEHKTYYQMSEPLPGRKHTIYINKYKYIYVGIASFGSNKCGSRGIVSVYSKITSYVDWIQANMSQ